MIHIEDVLESCKRFSEYWLGVKGISGCNDGEEDEELISKEFQIIFMAGISYLGIYSFYVEKLLFRIFPTSFSVQPYKRSNIIPVPSDMFLQGLQNHNRIGELCLKLSSKERPEKGSSKSNTETESLEKIPLHLHHTFRRNIHAQQY